MTQQGASRRASQAVLLDRAEEDYFARVEQDELASAEEEHFIRIEQDELASAEEEHFARIEQDELASAEEDAERIDEPDVDASYEYDVCEGCGSPVHETAECEVWSFENAVANDVESVDSYPDRRVAPGASTNAAESCEPATDESRLRARLDEAHAWAEPQCARVAVVVTPPGLGKTREALKRLAAESGGTLLATSHALLDEREAEATDLGLPSGRRAYGLTRFPGENGKDPACQYAKTLRPWTELGLPLRTLACSDCPHRETCPAYKGIDGAGDILYGVQAQVRSPRMQKELRSPIIVDEMPALLDMRRIEISDLLVLENARSLRAVRWCASLTPMARIVRDTAQALLDEQRSLDPDDTLHPRRIGGTELRERFFVAADGEKAFARARRTLAAATGAWPEPPGGSIRSGKLRPSNYPRPDAREVLDALAVEGTDKADSREFGTACLVVAGRGEHACVHIEHRRLALDGWPIDQSYVLLDASGWLTEAILQAALPGWKVRLFTLDAPEPPCIRRLHLRTRSMTRQKLLVRPKTPSTASRALSHRGSAALARMVREIADRASPQARVGIITHKPVANILLACLELLEGKGDPAKVKRSRATRVLDELRRLRDEQRVTDVRVLWYGAQRGSNRLGDVDVLALIGDPWPELSAAAEDARTLGVDANLHSNALLQAEVLQALGRARAIRRGPGQPLTMIYAGHELPAAWADSSVEVAPLPGGGPVPSPQSRTAQSLARTVAERCGAVSPALLRFLAQHIDLVDDFWWAATGNKREDPTTSYCPPPGGAELVKFAELPRRTQGAKCGAAAPGASEVPTLDPTRPKGHWRWRELQPGAAARLAALITELLAVPRGRRRPSEPGDAA